MVAKSMPEYQKPEYENIRKDPGRYGKRIQEWVSSAGPNLHIKTDSKKATKTDSITAFERINCETLWRILREKGINWDDSVYKQSVVNHVRIRNQKSEIFTYNSGTKQ